MVPNTCTELQCSCVQFGSVEWGDSGLGLMVFKVEGSGASLVLCRRFFGL